MAEPLADLAGAERRLELGVVHLPDREAEIRPQPVSVSAMTVAMFANQATDPNGRSLTVDLRAQRIAASDGLQATFEIAPNRKDALLRGLDAIDATLDHADEIRAFEARHRTAQPWLA